MIIWIDKNTRTFFEMETEPKGMDLENFEYKEIDIEEYRKIEELKKNNSVIYTDKFEVVKYKYEPTREEILENLKKQLNEIKHKKIEKGIEIMPNTWHPARDTDKINLSIVAQTIGEGTRKWKCFSDTGEPVVIDIDKKIINEILAKGIELLDGLIIGEAYALKILEKLGDDELKTVDVEAVYNKAISDYKGTTVK